ncbi:protein of unknown function [Streptantibioticus cattleyicolor NRRL 8057 = DSM 46488]|nr:protein of unknown function [Streptantibioticus cattleyicolor NRRL 8057 = DSM 46488]
MPLTACLLDVPVALTHATAPLIRLPGCRPPGLDAENPCVPWSARSPARRGQTRVPPSAACSPWPGPASTTPAGPRWTPGGVLERDRPPAPDNGSSPRDVRPVAA